MGVDYLVLRRRDPARGWGTFLLAGLFLALVPLLFQPLLVKAGSTPFLELPALRWEIPAGPHPVLEIGGRVSLESVVFGASTGLALLVVLLTFAAFSALADPYHLLRGLPPFLHRSAVVVSIAVTFVPQMMVAQREIREAQALRGHRFRRLGDLVPLFVALLGEGLERSMTLAESMESRGFGTGAGGTAAPPWVSRAAVAGGLGLVAAGAYLRSTRPQTIWGNAAMAAGAAVVLAALWSAGRRGRRSRFRHEVWRRRDTLVTGAAALSLAAIVASWALGRGALSFYPYPTLHTPGFAPGVAAALALLAAPAAVAGPPGGEAR